jgi:hypothetical protein
MRKIIEYTLASIDGVFAGPETRRFFDYRDDAYYRDGLGLLVSCDAMLMGRVTYEELAKIFAGRSSIPGPIGSTRSPNMCSPRHWSTPTGTTR